MRGNNSIDEECQDGANVQLKKSQRMKSFVVIS